MSDLRRYELTCADCAPDIAPRRGGTWCRHDEAAAALREQAERIAELEAENAAIAEAIGGSEYMDPPDGGDVPLAEQVGRMRAENERLRSELSKAEDTLDAFRNASLLITSSGDAADIEPHHVEREMMRLRADLQGAEQRVAALTETLTPSDETKAAFWGEFTDGPNVVSWTCIKSIMSAFRQRAQAEGSD